MYYHSLVEEAMRAPPPCWWDTSSDLPRASSLANTVSGPSMRCFSGRTIILPIIVTGSMILRVLRYGRAGPDSGVRRPQKPSAALRQRFGYVFAGQDGYPTNLAPSKRSIGCAYCRPGCFVYRNGAKWLMAFPG